MCKLVLSVCISLHNRREVVDEHIKKLLKIDDDRFDIIVSDSSDLGKDLLSMKSDYPEKVKIFTIDPNTPPMSNWKFALDHADGAFCFHLNDRDIIHEDELSRFIDFLDTHRDHNGGLCKYVSTSSMPKLFREKDEAFMNLAYFASHPTGMVFNTESYKRLGDVREVFDKRVGIHPHDIILGRLSQSGKMFIYTDKLWDMASPDFYKKNISGFQAKADGMFFDPKERLYELNENMKQIGRLDFSESIKEKKKDQMIKTYLGLSTNGYFYVIESEYESAHYGIKREKMGAIKRYSFAMNVLDMFDKELHFSKQNRANYRKWLIKTITIPIIAKYTSKINNQRFRMLLRKMRVRRDTADNALLR